MLFTVTLNHPPPPNKNFDRTPPCFHPGLDIGLPSMLDHFHKSGVFINPVFHAGSCADILDRCNTRYHRLRLLVNKKWGPSPATLIQIYKQCVRPIFEYGSVSTITTSDNIISKIQRLQNKFIRLALRLPKYICPRLLHDSSGLPYVKDRLLSCATKSLDRIAQNPLVGESISSHRLNPAWDRFPTPLSVVRPVSS